MKTIGNKRYSIFLRPISYIIDLSLILLFAYFTFDFELSEFSFFAFSCVVGWVVLSINSSFYEVYRFTKVGKIVSQSVTHFFVFTFMTFTFFRFFFEGIENRLIAIFLGFSFSFILLAKFTLFYFLKRYRSVYGKNFRKTIIIGSSTKTFQLKQFFLENPEYGYQYERTFFIGKGEKGKQELEKIYNYIHKNEIHEIYCSVSNIDNEYINNLINFADNNLIVIKFLPDNKDVFSKKLRVDYYGVLPILSIRNIPLEDSINLFQKRVFDLLVSSFVIVFFLSWFTPLIALLIRLESKGPIFFKQIRTGLGNEEFSCLKFRSMVPNQEADLNQAQKNDRRVTKIGEFLRKTSLDEMPQFFNVFTGDMSVVGPRPHMVSDTNMYAKQVDKFMLRHFIKPGITGLAQVSGFRGEIETEIDIINRVKYDIFYIENWSLFLDIKIILLTATNIFKGEEKAY